MVRATIPPIEQITHNGTHPRFQNYCRVAIFAKRVARQLISDIGKTADQLITLLHLDDRFAGQDELVFEKQSD
jgi:hypothetical protein